MRSNPERKGNATRLARRKTLVSLSDYLRAPSEETATEFRHLTQDSETQSARPEPDPKVGAPSASVTASSRDHAPALGPIARFVLRRLGLTASDEAPEKSSIHKPRQNRLEKYDGD